LDATDKGHTGLASYYTERGELWAQHPKAWQKIAIVSDADWLENSVKAFGWLIPGEVKVFETGDLDDAKEWLSEANDEDD
jgi:SpoIIAA-like